METIFIAGTIGTNLVTIGILVAISIRFSRAEGLGNEAAQGDASEALEQVSTLLGRVTDLERTWTREMDRLEALQEAIYERVEAGNKAWRRVRAAQRRQESDEEEDGGGELPEGNARGSQAQGVLPLHQSMGPSLKPHEALSKQLARSLAWGE